MNFHFTQEQQMVQDSVSNFLGEFSDSAAVRSAMQSDTGYDLGLWQRICEDMCWQAATIPEQYSGLGLGYVELAIMQEQMGRHLLCSPFFSTVCLAANALLVAANETQKTEYLPKIAEGRLSATLAWMGKGFDWGVNGVSAIWREHEDGYLLDGKCLYVVDGHSADLLLIAAREESSVGCEGIALFICPADSAGISRAAEITMDQSRRLASIEMRNVRLPVSSRFGDGELLDKILQLAQIALAAEQLGGCQQVLNMAVDYSQERVQFDRPVASFQAIKHKAADMMVKAESSRSAVYYAACVADEALQERALNKELTAAASVAKACCSEAFFFNAGSALQIFGGVGFTWEYDIHLYFKRARATETFLGNAEQHRERLAEVILD